MSSAQVIRDCKTYFNPSKLFTPVIEQCKIDRANENRRAGPRKRASRRPIEVKIGHGGTLDPMATGVLILGFGKGTKALNSFLGCTKTYETVVVFGASSDSYDRCGHLLKKRPYDHITRDKVEEALDSFRGTYQQMPPLFSALKMNGKPLYEYAREGKPIPRKIETREVTVSKCEVLEWYEPGTHSHHWPTTEATAAEKQYAEQLWRVEKQQSEGKNLSAEEEAADSQALAEHNDLKRKFEEKQDDLVVDRQAKKQRNKQQNDVEMPQPEKETDAPTSPVMSGALGELPLKGKGSDLIPAVMPGTPPPWKDKGPPAVKIRICATSGFYVRSFAHDLGEKLDSAGMMAELVRTKQGDFELGGLNCLEYTELAKGEEVWAPMVQSMLDRWNAGTSPAPAERDEKKSPMGSPSVSPVRTSGSPHRDAH